MQLNFYKQPISSLPSDLPMHLTYFLGCLKMTTTMTLDGPYQYLPRKRKEVILDSSAAGIRGSVRHVINRFNCDAKLKDNPDQTITVRSAI